MQQRYYDPAVGRFLSIDPMRVNSNWPSNFGRYYYGENNPYRFKDPDGRTSEDPWIDAAGKFFVNLVAGGNTESDIGSMRAGSQAMAGDVSASVRAAPELVKQDIAGAKESIPTRKEVAAGADKIARNAGRTEAVAFVASQLEIAAPAGTVALGASAVALVAEPTKERAVSFGLAAVTGGVSKGLEKAGHVVPAGSVTVGNQAVDEIDRATKADE
jgi:hypothetical protein